MLPLKNSEYGTLEYWNSRYEQDKGDFDWFGNFEGGTKTTLLELIKKSDRILHLGCGNSLLTPQMYLEGYSNIINMDYSPPCIEQMQEKYPEMDWIVGDIFDLDECVGDKLFDVALDKGTLDALLTSKHDPWDPEPHIVEQINIYMENVYKHLKKGGSFIHITFVQPHFRRRFLDGKFDKVQVHSISTSSGGFDYYCYQGSKL